MEIPYKVHLKFTKVIIFNKKKKMKNYEVESHAVV